jgi:hypothetical protein
VARAVPGGEYDAGLHGEVDGQQPEGGPDQAERATLPVPAAARQFPDHHGGRADLDERVEAESGEGDGARCDRGHREDRDPGDVPPQGDVLEDEPSAQQGAAVGVLAGCHHGILPRRVEGVPA